MIVKIYRNSKHKIICFIEQIENGKFKTKVGKPSDICNLTWSYDTFDEAKLTAYEFYSNYMAR